MTDDEPKVPKAAVIDEATRAKLDRWFGGGPDEPQPKTSDEPVAAPDGPKVKDLLGGQANLSDVVDEATRAELERWFGLPSFLELAERPVDPEDPETIALRERRERVLGEVDPALLERLRLRAGLDILPVREPPKLRNDPKIAMIDLEGIERLANMIAEPRQVVRPDVIDDDLRDVTPQALLRDLHRSEETFRKQFEIIDMAAEQRLDIVAEVDKAMRTDWKLPRLDIAPFREGHAILQDARRIRHAPFNWDGLPTPHRWVKDWS